MPDSWEADHGLNPQADDAHGDLDGDTFGNLFEFLAGTDPDDSNSKPLRGDINLDGAVDLADVISALQVLTGTEPISRVYKEMDVNGDGRIGLEEVIFLLQELSTLVINMD